MGLTALISLLRWQRSLSKSLCFYPHTFMSVLLEFILVYFYVYAYVYAYAFMPVHHLAPMEVEPLEPESISLWVL